MKELVVDNFAGGGGASSGIEAAIGKPIDYAINHDPEAIAMHRINHPNTRHYCSSVWDVNPTQLAAGRPVGLGWFSPDCTFYSIARGGKPFRDRDMARRRRGLANLIPRWASTPAAPRVICLENVREFSDWGPLTAEGRIDPKRRGMMFRRWHRQLENLGYRIDMRELRACDYGAPTSRKRLFIVMRRDGGEIIFPPASHGPWRGAQPYLTAADCIDWSIPCTSIFERKKPLVEASMRRIARGIMRDVVKNPKPFIVTLRGTSDAHIDTSVSTITDPLRTVSAGGRHHALVVPIIASLYSDRSGTESRCQEITRPLPTITATPRHALVAAFLEKHCGGGNYTELGADLRDPMSTITTVDHHTLVTAFLLKYYGTDQDPQLGEPLHTITTKARFGVVMVYGEPHRIVDIRTRMLTPRELFTAQGFGSDYIIDRGIDEYGQPVRLSGTAQVRMCGNSVSPHVAEALVRANYVEQQILRKVA
jgi:DNA (cytosine-5)-methyltransferase 1